MSRAALKTRSFSLLGFAGMFHYSVISTKAHYKCSKWRLWTHTWNMSGIWLRLWIPVARKDWSSCGFEGKKIRKIREKGKKWQNCASFCDHITQRPDKSFPFRVISFFNYSWTRLLPTLADGVTLLTCKCGQILRVVVTEFISLSVSLSLSPPCSLSLSLTLYISLCVLLSLTTHTVKMVKWLFLESPLIICPPWAKLGSLMCKMWGFTFVCFVRDNKLISSVHMDMCA